MDRQFTDIYFTWSFIVRLVNGSTLYEGRVEVQYNGLWGTVCDYGWDLNDAQVVCNQLGFGKATDVLYNSFFGEGSGQTWLAYLNCAGNELSIGNCSHNGWGYYYCGQARHAGLKCSTGMYTMSQEFIKMFVICKF